MVLKIISYPVLLKTSIICFSGSVVGIFFPSEMHETWGEDQSLSR